MKVAPPSANTKPADHDQHHMAGDHIGEQRDGQGDRAMKYDITLDRHHQRQQPARHAFRHEEGEEVHAVMHETDHCRQDEHHQRQGEGDDDMAGDGEDEAVRSARHQADQVEEQQNMKSVKMKGK